MTEREKNTRRVLLYRVRNKVIKSTLIPLSELADVLHEHSGDNGSVDKLAEKLGSDLVEAILISEGYDAEINTS